MLCLRAYSESTSMQTVFNTSKERHHHADIALRTSKVFGVPVAQLQLLLGCRVAHIQGGCYVQRIYRLWRRRQPLPLALAIAEFRRGCKCRFHAQLAAQCARCGARRAPDMLRPTPYTLLTTSCALHVEPYMLYSAPAPSTTHPTPDTQHFCITSIV